ncbi:hypothetical protein BAE44_0023611 [Dichanthelium oligosanthes]|uniref:Uncharacterized protein n=1 Tax=Dichanthelium oligosanthes TaxID=888268 RepID=A0A1E5UR89_9POAL|nr:hypothetical protein BAE44_0023611 [Dichanthelium oligosanthes]
MYIILVKFLDHNMRISFLAFCIVPVTSLRHPTPTPTPTPHESKVNFTSIHLCSYSYHSVVTKNYSTG